MRKIEEGSAPARDRDVEIISIDGAREPEAGPLPMGLDIERFRPVSLNRGLLANNRIVADESSAAGDAYRMLRTRVLQRMRLNGWKSLVVTGTCPEEGKSLTAINLSLNLARGVDTSVVLVDLSRIAVFDMPPVLVSDDVLAFSPHVDAVLLVLAEGKTRHADLAAVRDLLQGVNILGAVLNYSSDDVAPYYYYGRR